MYLLKITFANGLPQNPPNLITVTKTGLLQSGQRTGVHGHGGGCKLHGSTYQVFWRVSGPGSVELRESRRPRAEGVPCPPPLTEKIRTPIFLQFGACPDFSCRDTLRTRSGSVSRKFWVAPFAKNQDTILPAVLRRVRFFSGNRSGSVSRKFRVPPPLRGRVQGREGFQVFSGAVSSGQLKYAVHTPLIFPMLREEA